MIIKRFELFEAVSQKSVDAANDVKIILDVLFNTVIGKAVEAVVGKPHNRDFWRSTKTGRVYFTNHTTTYIERSNYKGWSVIFEYHARIIFEAYGDTIEEVLEKFWTYEAKRYLPVGFNKKDYDQWIDNNKNVLISKRLTANQIKSEYLESKGWADMITDSKLLFTGNSVYYDRMFYLLGMKRAYYGFKNDLCSFTFSDESPLHKIGEYMTEVPTINLQLLKVPKTTVVRVNKWKDEIKIGDNDIKKIEDTFIKKMISVLIKKKEATHPTFTSYIYNEIITVLKNGDYSQDAKEIMAKNYAKEINRDFQNLKTVPLFLIDLVAQELNTNAEDLMLFRDGMELGFIS